MPDVVGVHMHGTLADGVTATDLVLFITELLAQNQSCRQICRVSRRGRGKVAGDQPRDDREHGTRVRRDDGLFSN